MRYLQSVCLFSLTVLLAACQPTAKDRSAPSHQTTPNQATPNQAGNQLPKSEKTGAPAQANGKARSTQNTKTTMPAEQNPRLGLPPVPIPADNPMSADKIALGERLFLDTRFSADGKVSCSTCHDPAKAFTDHKPTSNGFMNKTGTRNAPTVINAAFNRSQFWDGRRPDLEGQSMDPPVNPVEGGLPNHEPILNVIRDDPDYVTAFKQVFDIEGKNISMTHVAKAIGAFERTIVSGNSAFDRYYFGGDTSAMSEAALRGFDIFVNQGRCAGCHTLDQKSAIFTDHKFHNLGIGFKRITNNLESVAGSLIAAKRQGALVDTMVLSDPNASELGRFALNGEWQDIGQFKTPGLRNVAATAPYMHDGSLKTLKDVVKFYNDTVAPGDTNPPNPFQSGGIRPLNLSDAQQADLVAFLESLTSPEYLDAAEAVK